MLTTLAEKVAPEHTAFVVVDMQNDYCHLEGACALAGIDPSAAQAIVPLLNRVITAARVAGVKLIFTRNWLSPRTTSEVQKSRAATSKRKMGRTAQAGTWGADWYGVAPHPEDFVVSKPRYDAFLGTDLEWLLRAQGIRTLVFAGVATNVCVESTARAAYMRDFYVVLLEDCCAGSSPALHAAALENVRTFFGDVVTAREVLALWMARPAPLPFQTAET
jgi:ureidoacrylate peracid hydrolase